MIVFSANVWKCGGQWAALTSINKRFLCKKNPVVNNLQKFFVSKYYYSTVFCSKCICFLNLRLCFNIFFLCYFAVAAAKTCHCTESQQLCSNEGTCESPLLEEDFSCLVSRQYDDALGIHRVFQQCILGPIDYGIFCNSPSVDGLVIFVSCLASRT